MNTRSHLTGHRRFTVEDCIALCLRGPRKRRRALKQSGDSLVFLQREPGPQWALLQHHGWQAVQYSCLTVFDDHSTREVEFTWGGRQWRQTVKFVTTRQRLGGERTWFVCDRSKPDGTHCEARVNKLFLPPNCPMFACRKCHDLGYQSSLKSHQEDAIYRHAAQRLELDVDIARQLLTYHDRRGPKRSQPPQVPPDWDPPGIDLAEYPTWYALRQMAIAQRASETSSDKPVSGDSP